MVEFAEERHRAITLCVAQEKKNNLGAAESTHGVVKVVKSIVGVWSKDKEEVFIVGESERRIGVDEDWTNGVRTIGREGKWKVETIAKIKTLKPLCKHKQKALKLCRDEKVWTK